MKNKKNIFIAIVVVVIALVLVATWFYQSKVSTHNPALDDILKKVAKHIVVPPDTAPVMFDVKDPEVLVKEQAFFAGAVVGDKLIIFPQSNRAIIYSPSRDILINVGPINYEAGTEITSSTSTTE